MSRFRYRMQNILDIKNKLEDQAKMEYAAARAELTEEEEKLLLLEERKEAYLEEGRRLRGEKLKIRDIRDNKTALTSMDEYIRDQKLRITAAQRKLEAARQKLTEVMQERKTHEKLREKAFEQFLMDEKATEGKEIDELTSYLYGQKTGE